MGFLNWIKSLFCGSSIKVKLGILLATFLAKSTDVIAKELLNPENQKKAYEFVKELNKRDDIDNTEKAKIFNKQMAEWAGKLGKKLGNSIINCLREMAVNALKLEGM